MNVVVSKKSVKQTPFSIGFFGGAQGWEEGKKQKSSPPLPHFYTSLAMMKTVTVTLYL